MATLNKCMLIGNVGRDPEKRFLPSGECVVSLSLATTNRWKDPKTGEKKESTDWHRVTAFGKAAEVIAEYVRKGHPLYVEGQIRYSAYTDKNGVEKYATDIRVSGFQLLKSRDDYQPREPGSTRAASGDSFDSRDHVSQPRAPATSTGSGFDDMDDDIPF